jgi:hypothetical protein
LEDGILSKEDLSEVDYIFLPFTIDGEQEFVKCSSFEDIYRGRIGTNNGREIKSSILILTDFYL